MKASLAAVLTFVTSLELGSFCKTFRGKNKAKEVGRDPNATQKRLCSARARQSTPCYTCKEPTDLHSCMSYINCSMGTTACKTTVLSVDSAKSYPLAPPPQAGAAAPKGLMYPAGVWIRRLRRGYPFFGNITVTKSCAEKCVPSDPDGIGESHPDYCCYTDLCNVGAGQVAVTFSALAVTVAVAFALLWTRF